MGVTLATGSVQLHYQNTGTGELRWKSHCGLIISVLPAHYSHILLLHLCIGNPFTCLLPHGCLMYKGDTAEVTPLLKDVSLCFFSPVAGCYDRRLPGIAELYFSCLRVRLLHFCMFFLSIKYGMEPPNSVWSEICFYCCRLIIQILLFYNVW